LALFEKYCYYHGFIINLDLYGLEDGSIPATFEVDTTNYLHSIHIFICFVLSLNFTDRAYDRLEPRRLSTQGLQTRLGQQVFEGLVRNLGGYSK
jgi:hypothetical protein